MSDNTDTTKEPRRGKHERRCSECRNWIDHSDEYGAYDHDRDCPLHPGPPDEVPDEKIAAEGDE